IARQLEPQDQAYDHIFAMDKDHLEHLRRMFPGAQAKIRLLLEDAEVPDPYYGGPEGFEEVYRMLEGAIQDFLGR
ncbi:MAG: phosphotyrosine protein phosphatase, partial [Meiothermus sp.]